MRTWWNRNGSGPFKLVLIFARRKNRRSVKEPDVCLFTRNRKRIRKFTAILGTWGERAATALNIIQGGLNFTGEEITFKTFAECEAPAEKGIQAGTRMKGLWDLRLRRKCSKDYSFWRT